MKKQGLSFVLSLSLVAFGLQAQPLKEKLEKFVSDQPRPQNVEDFQALFHFTPRNQDTTLVCWSFSTTSFIETEMKRLGLEPVPLARMYPVYHVFLEKAKRFVETRGKSRFSPGDLFSGVLDVIKKYGIVPESAYRGQTRVCETYNHEEMYGQLDQLMKKVRADSLWDEAKVLSMVTPILDRHLGKPPEDFNFKGRTYSPKAFFDQVVRLPWEEYVTVTSFLYGPFNRFVELKVPDNWMHHKNYFNVPLDVFYGSIREALGRGYSLAIDADISEPSYEQTKEHCIIPDFDLPLAAISQEAREFRFNSGSTTDDHLMHIIGFKKFGDQDWFLVKDSWRTAYEGKLNGYFFFHDSYVKMKVLAYLVHRDGVPAIRKLVMEQKGGE